MESKNLTLVFAHFEKEHLGKDVFLVPYYLGKELSYEVTIVYKKTKTNNLFKNNNYKGVKLRSLINIFKLKKLQNISFFLSSLLYVIKNGKKIDLLMTFHFRFTSAILCILYKMINPNGKFYLKVDGGEDILDVKNNSSFIKNQIYNKLLKKCDYISVETHLSFKLWNENLNISEKIFLVENGFDEEELMKLSLNVIPFSEKENKIITVGRLGTSQKNTVMFLKAIEKISNFKNWKFYFIGTIEENFQKEIKLFYHKNPSLKNKVIFTGPILEKKILWEYYNKAKVFVLTSIWEGYAIVFSEAYRFNNYIISTDVGGAKETIEKNENFGKLVGQNNDEDLKSVLEQIINDNNYLIKYPDKDHSDNSWQICLKSLVDSIKNNKIGV
ncbi:MULTISPECIES: glycosyltransferase [unclassified Apibacter]|uniref:glycosyltransferase n=1 Tax=unclassified Apibacter TaxID=2630820 RepID=UPI001326ACD5|nr:MULTISPECIES: glycosyltransferase [unclassified Apibacter]MCX8676845.1 glycosyltransferase [Apibacter sp. B3919]MXO24773.1 glycosyltransferase [Apibacter sp. B3924]MXO26017.1 glycosyltransferase [Apibacter sp. B3813]MXO27968.1 glycosyltransferase [Apibacter sp. B3913]MXO29672.1 glycosyltransferase [Apibacter sp. B3912]